MASYDAYLDGKLEDYEMPAEEITPRWQSWDVSGDQELAIGEREKRAQRTCSFVSRLFFKGCQTVTYVLIGRMILAIGEPVLHEIVNALQTPAFVLGNFLGIFHIRIFCFRQAESKFRLFSFIISFFMAQSTKRTRTSDEPAEPIPHASRASVARCGDLPIHDLSCSRRTGIVASRRYAALEADKYIFLAAQQDPTVDEPTQEDIFKEGVVAKIVQILKLPNGMLKILVDASYRQASFAI